jgi:predicted solute-binding protein
VHEALKKKAAKMGVDEETWEEYFDHLAPVLYVVENPTKLRERFVEYAKRRIDKLAGLKVVLQITHPYK